MSARVEAAADIIVQGDRGACECRRSIFDKHNVNPPCSTRQQANRTAAAALAAADAVMFDDAAVEPLPQIIHDNLCGCGEEYVECNGDLSDSGDVENAARAVIAALKGDDQ